MRVELLETHKNNGFSYCLYFAFKSIVFLIAKTLAVIVFHKGVRVFNKCGDGGSRTHVHRG